MFFLDHVIIVLLLICGCYGSGFEIEIGFDGFDVVLLRLSNINVWGLEVVVLVVVDCNRQEVYHRLLDEGDAGNGYYTYHFGLTMIFFC